MGKHINKPKGIWNNIGSTSKRKTLKNKYKIEKKVK